MGTSRQDLTRWFDQGVAQKASHMIVVCDTFDYEDFPVYVDKVSNFYDVYNKYTNGQNMARIMEVYDLNKDKSAQMTGRVMNLP